MRAAAGADAGQFRQRRPLLGLAVLGALSLQALHALAGGRAFVATPPGVGRSVLPRPRLERRPTSALAAVGAGAEEEMSDIEKFFDRWNTRGGAILATFLGFIGGWALEKGLELVGVESTTAGIWTSGVLFFGLLAWTTTYFTRVMTKSTTYATQLEMYEREVMLKRLKELDEEEIAALCEEVGISQEEISDAVGDKVEALSQKEKVLQLFKNTRMPKDVDPRSMMGA